MRPERRRARSGGAMNSLREASAALCDFVTGALQSLIALAILYYIMGR